MRNAGEEISRPAIARGADIIRTGGVVAFPTETVYGLGADAYNAEAVARIFEIKGRPRFDPLIVHICDIASAESLAAEFPPQALLLAEKFWPGPLTLILRKRPVIPGIVTAGMPTVAIRMPSHPSALELIRLAGVPIAAPSANPFGRISPTTAEHVREQLADTVDFIINGGPCTVGVESTIVSLAGDKPVLLRPGGTPAEEIEKITGPLTVPERSEGPPESPGRLDSHYAPRTPLYLKADARPLPKSARAGLLAFRTPEETEGFAAVEVLSKKGSLREAAANLFAAMHRLDALDLDVIIADPPPEEGLGRAVNDRLRRAARQSR
ncbi:MAG: L-threonylcarbamoyladenylate synthase [Spirochaetia bacterium]